MFVGFIFVAVNCTEYVFSVYVEVLMEVDEKKLFMLAVKNET